MTVARVSQQAVECLRTSTAVKSRWQGRLSPRLNSDGAFEQFQDPIMGLRVAAVLLITHYDRRHLDTIRKLVEVWAPPNDDGSTEKNDDWHGYASAAAAGFAKHFLLDRPLDPRHKVAPPSR